MQNYKVKLASGRILGPVDIERVRLLILKKQIVGTETAREYPQGDWKDINQISEIAALLIAHIGGKLEKGLNHSFQNDSLLGGKTQVFSGPTQVLTPTGNQNAGKLPLLDLTPRQSLDPLQEDSSEKALSSNDGDERTQMVSLNQEERIGEDRTRIEVPEAAPEIESQIELNRPSRQVSQEKTVFFERSSKSPGAGGQRPFSLKQIIQGLMIAGILGSVGYDFLFSEADKKPIDRIEIIRPKLPEYQQNRSDSSKSMQIYNDAMKDYLTDTVLGYRSAAKKLREAASYDISNVKALAMLASSYINLIDSSNKDDSYFSVISKLIDMSRAKAIDLPETVIADVEFFITVKKAEAAQNRIVEYTKSHQNYGFEMFYYLALAFYERGDANNAARYLAQFPDNKAFSAKVFYLRGQIAEKLNDPQAALLEYEKAEKFNANHAKSHLRIAYLFNKKGSLKESVRPLEYLINHPTLLAPRDLGLAYYLYAQSLELYGKIDLALGYMERAVKLDSDNHDYMLEMYTLQSQVLVKKKGEVSNEVKQQGRMYAFLSEGENYIRQGKYQEALVPLLQAREVNDQSPLPLIKIGDMFNYLNEVDNARNNYKLATLRAPNNIQVWSKYIQTLIQSYEWDEAKKAMDKFRSLPVGQSAIDKAAADMYQKQGRFVEAQVFYKKAMARDVIDPDVYIAFAKSLMATHNFKEAPFFFALALRFDPLNVDGVIGTAKCVAETESIDRAISMLQDELKQSSGARAEFLAAIAEFQIQKGAWEQAQQSVEQAVQANPGYAYPWKLQAQIYMNREGLDKDALDKALFAYKSYSERNASDPSGYLERYKIFTKKAQFEKAKEELNRIYEIYPKYPNLHFYLGTLYTVQGNHKAAAEEFRVELSNNPDNVQTLLAFGRELMELNDAQTALVQFTKAMSLAPGSGDAKQNAGWANHHLKNYQAAVTLLRAALTIDTANPTVFKRLGIVYRDMGDLAAACGAFRKYLEMEPDASDKAEFQACL